jgi:uncharacterized membrane protein YfcA
MTSWQFLEYLVLGTGAGLLSGLFGVGGGLLVVPGLLWVLAQQGFASDVIMQYAVGTSLATMVVTALSSAWGHWRRQVPFWQHYRLLMPGLVVGVLCGVWFGHLLHSDWLRTGFGVLVLSVAVRTARNARRSRVSRANANKQLPLPVLGGMIGLQSGFFGIGAGILSPLMVARGICVREAIATCACCSLTVAVLGASMAMWAGQDALWQPARHIGYVFWPAVLCMTLTSPLAAWCGVRLSHHLSTVVLQWCFVVFLCLVAIKCFAPLWESFA